MRGILFGLFLFSILISNFSKADTLTPYCPDALSWKVNVPGNALETLSLAAPEQKLNFDHLKILVWNIYKGGKPGVYADLDYLTQNVDLALLQEGHLSSTFINLICSRENMSWIMAHNYTDTQGIHAGVVTASKANPDDAYFIKSPDTEAFSDIHKMTLVSIYSLPERNDSVMIINIHGINFVPHNYYVNQIKEIAKAIQSHTGPIILAGDFNTYTSARTDYLLKTMKDLGLNHAKVSGNEYNGFLVLDHLFYRGFEVVKSEALTHVSSSDHKPMSFELKLLK